MRILCVDNDQRYLASMVKRIANCGFLVDSASDYQSALKLFTSDTFLYDVVVTDLDLRCGAECDGEHLSEAIVGIRETRGYHAAPEIICLTGAASKIDPQLRNRLHERGCHYVLKGTDQYILEIKAAAMRIQAARKHGPTLLFRHSSSVAYHWDDRRSWDCAVGEDIEGVYIMHDGQPLEVGLGKAPLRLLDFLARRAWRRAYSADEVASAMAISEFYTYWNPETSFTRNSVKNNVRRIRVALGETFRSFKLSFSYADVLSTDRNEEKDSELDRIEGYRFSAKAIVEHLPS